MKKLFLFLVVISSLLSCQKDKVCPKNYTGSNCDKEVAPGRVRIKTIQISNFPGTNNGKNWDVNSAYPDPYFEIKDLTGVVYASQYLDNQQPGSISQWNVDIVLIPGNPYVILFNDEDGDSDDLIDSSVLYYYIEGEGFPDRYTFTGSNGSQISVWVTYEY